ncbi:S-adenosylmethionine decarboxylase [Aureispira sp. CCB-QB1]|uniref:S-adenosylmethionine decarboxylase n=1 Tax=Aureispira sp. CCB-QB1 TaxID=1313421 RepID=UPI000696E906|nr:S-adenosylmethionine decarboxylase [Aureispira sp. CCB-QB1]
MKNLAPTIHRQRLVIEGTCKQKISASKIEEYLEQLSEVLDMSILMKPITHQSPKFGWAGWVHWETSGSHFYAWDEPFPFFSADIYTCKAFDNRKAVEFTKDFFNAQEIVFKAF